MARAVTGGRVEPGGLGGVSNQNKRNETVATGSSAVNPRINAGGAAGVARTVSPARFCPGSPHGDSFTSVPTSSVPPTPTSQTRPGSKDNPACLMSTAREPAAGVAQVANAAPPANQLSRSEQFIIKHIPVAQASNSERTVRFNPVVEILECPRRRCGGGRGGPGGSPLSPPPMLPPSPPLSRRGSRPRGSGLRATQHHRSPTPPPSHRKGARNYMSGGVGSNAAGGSGVPDGIRGLGEGSGVGLVRNRRSLRLPSPTSGSPSTSTSNMGVTHQGPVRLAWRALAGRSAPRQVASLRPLRRRSGPGPTLATKGVRGRGQRSNYGMASSPLGVTRKPSKSNTSASANALGASTTQPSPPPGPASQSTPALQSPSTSNSQQQGNVPLPPSSSQEMNFTSANTTPVDSRAAIPLPPPPPPAPTPAPPSSAAPIADTTETRVGSAGSRGTYHTARNASPSTSSTSTRSGSEPPSGHFFGPKTGRAGLRPAPAKMSMSLATAQSTMAGVALARARAAALVARAGIIDTTPPAPPPSRGSEFGTSAANTMVVANAATTIVANAATTLVAVANKLSRGQQDDTASSSSKAYTDTSSAPAISMALMHPLPLPATAISSTRDARIPSVPLTAPFASVSVVNQRPTSTEGKETVASQSPTRSATKGNKTVTPSRPGSNTHPSKASDSVPASQVKDSSPTSNNTNAAPGTSTNKPGGDEGPSTSTNNTGYSILSGVPSVTGGCLAELLSRSRNASLAEQSEAMLRIVGARNTAATRTEVPATWSVDTSADDKATSLAATVEAASTERSRAAGDSIIGKSKEHLSSKAVQPFSPTTRKQTPKGPKTPEVKKSAVRDRLSSTLDERGDRTEKGERIEKVEKSVSLKNTVDNTESGKEKYPSGSSLNSMLKVAAPKGLRKKSQKRNHSVDKDHTREIVPANSVPNVNDSIPTPPPPAPSAAISPPKIIRAPGSGGSSGGGGGGSGLTSGGGGGSNRNSGGGGCLAGLIGGGGGNGGATAGIVAGGGGISSLVRVESGPKANRISIGGGLEKMISISPKTSKTSQMSQQPTTLGDVTSAHMDVKVGKKGKRKATDELLDAAKVGKIKVKEKKKKSPTGKVTKKKDDGSRILLKGVKDGSPRRSLSLTELGRTLRSGCWTLVEACIRGTKAATNGIPPQLTVVFRAKGSGPTPGTPMFRPPPTPPAATSSQRQWTNRPARLTSASTSSRLSVVGEKNMCRGKAGSTRGSSAGSSRDMHLRNSIGGRGFGGGASGGATNVRNIRRRSTQKRRPNTPARRRVPSGMVRLRGPRRGRRSSGAGLDSRGSTGSANRLRTRALHRTTLAPPARRTNRGARSTRRNWGGSTHSLTGRRAIVPYNPPPTRGRYSRPISRNYPRTR